MTVRRWLLSACALVAAGSPVVITLFRDEDSLQDSRGVITSDVGTSNRIDGLVCINWGS